MFNPPDYRNRSSNQILSEHLYFDSVGHVYRAVSWLDYFERTKRFSSLHYSFIEARMGIEHLLFEIRFTPTPTRARMGANRI